MGDDGREGDVRGEKRGRQEGKEGAGGKKKGEGGNFARAKRAPLREGRRRQGVGGGGEGDRGREGGEAYPLSTPSNIGGQWEKADSFNCTL